MIILIYGEDNYRSQEKLREITESYKKTHKTGLSLRYFDGEKLDFQDFKNETRSVSMFGEKKLIIIKDIVKNKIFKENFFKNLKEFVDSKDIILFFEKEKIPEEKFFKEIKKQGKFQEFSLLLPEQIKFWAKKEFGKYGIKIDDEILKKTIDSSGNDLWQLSNEIKKISLFAKGSNKTAITKDDLEFLIKPKTETDIFKTIDALALKNKKMAINLIHRHLQKGDNPQYIFSMINFQFRNLLMVKSAGNRFQNLGLHPYVLKKTISQVAKFTLEELKKIYQKLFEVDLNTKTGKLDPETALDLFVAQI